MGGGFAGGRGGNGEIYQAGSFSGRLYVSALMSGPNGSEPGLKRALRRRAGYVSIALNVARRWSKPEPQPKTPIPLTGIRVNAIIAPWCEADVIASCVKNAYAQGCNRVLIIDNDSPDDTVQEARAAGAEIAVVYQTQHFDDIRRMSEIRNVVEEYSQASGEKHMWWLICDADEFSHGPAGTTIQEYVSSLDRRFRVAGARAFNHYPSGEHANVPGRHPLDFQPLCQEVRLAQCSLRHWKHPLFRWDHDGAPIGPVNNFHRIECNERLIEPEIGIFLHHFQYRERQATFDRLRRLCEPSDGGDRRTALQEGRLGRETGATRRFATLEYVYSQQWDLVERPAIDGHKRGVRLKPWNEQVSLADASVARWYPAEVVAQ